MAEHHLAFASVQKVSLCDRGTGFTVDACMVYGRSHFLQNCSSITRVGFTDEPARWFRLLHECKPIVESCDERVLGEGHEILAQICLMWVILGFQMRRTQCLPCTVRRPCNLCRL